MSKSNNTIDTYNMGMEFALRVAKKEGIEGLERELRARRTSPLPLNVSRNDLAQYTRSNIKTELMIVAVAMVYELVEGLKLPPTTILKYLHGFNERIDVYRYDMDTFKKDGEKLDKDGALNSICRKFVEERENEKQ